MVALQPSAPMIPEMNVVLPTSKLSSVIHVPTMKDVIHIS